MPRLLAPAAAVLMALAAGRPAAAQATPFPPVKPAVGSIRSLAFLPNARLLVGGDETDRRAVVWDLAAGREVQRFEMAGKDPPVFALTPDRGRVLAFAGGPAAVVYDFARGKPAATLAGIAGTPHAAAVGPDGTTALLAVGDGLQLWNLKSARLTQARRLQPAAIRVAIAPNGKQGAYGTAAGSVVVFDLKTWKPSKEFEAHHKKGIDTLFFGPDGATVVTTAVEANTAVVWDTKTGAPVRELAGHGAKGVTAAAGSDDGRYVVTSAWDQTIKVWDETTGAQVAGFGGQVWPGRVAVSPEGRFLAASDREKPLVHVWELPARKK